MKKTKGYLQIMLITVVSIFLILGLANIVLADEIDYNITTVKESLKATTKYDLRDSIDIKLKNQMQTYTCWAFSGTTALETYMKKVKNKNVEFSPRHIEYTTTRTFKDGTNEVAFNRELDSGGNNGIFSAYVTSGLGPVFEKDMPFINSKERINLEEIKNKENSFMIKEFISFPSIHKETKNGEMVYSNGKEGQLYEEYTATDISRIRDLIKNHIKNYGSVTIGIYYNEAFYSADGKSYYCGDSTKAINHGVSIIGWDDNYATNNFKEGIRPNNPGAWLIQDSHGDIKPYYYISYEDVCVETNTLGIVKMDFKDYDEIYQYDNAGSNAQTLLSISSTYAMNIFKKSNKVEYLKEIAIYTSPNEEFEIYVNSKDRINRQKQI